MANTAEQKSSFAQKIEYIDLPYYGFDKNFSRTAEIKMTCAGHVIHGLIRSLSSGGDVRLSYDDIHEITGYSKAAISEGITRLEDCQIIKQDKSNRSHTRYTIEKQEDRKGFIRLDRALFEIIERLYGDIHFTRKEKNIVCFLVGMASRNGADGKISCSYATIAKALDLHPSTAAGLIKKIIKAGVIHRPKGCRGTCASSPSEYILDIKLRLAYEKLKKRRAGEAIARHNKDQNIKPLEKKRNEQDPQCEEEKRKEYFAERESYYSKLQDLEDTRVEKNKRILIQDTEYQSIRSKLFDRRMAQNRAEIAHDREGWKRITKEIETLEGAKAARFIALGMTETDITPQRRCKSCGDKGILPSGRLCNCYPKGVPR